MNVTGVQVIGVDADDTLWHNETYFNDANEAYARLLGDHVEPAVTLAHLQRVATRNIGIYGYGVKGFTLSMIETALEICGPRLDERIVRAILDAGLQLSQQPMEPIEGVQDALVALAQRARLILITKGDLFHQEVKLAASGLGEFFEGVEIVSEKTPETYERVFRRYGADPSQAIMVGNSLKSDVLPALAAGARAALVPYAIIWPHEAADAPIDEPRYRELGRLGDLTRWLDEIAVEAA